MEDLLCSTQGQKTTRKSPLPLLINKCHKDNHRHYHQNFHLKICYWHCDYLPWKILRKMNHPVPLGVPHTCIRTVLHTHMAI